MNFELTEQQTLLQQTIRDFAQAEITPGASERDEAARFPRELIPKMADLGLFGVMIPENYGGGGFCPLGFFLIILKNAPAGWGAPPPFPLSQSPCCRGLF